MSSTPPPRCVRHWTPGLILPPIFALVLCLLIAPGSALGKTAAPGSTSKAAEPLFDRWYALTLNGGHVGYVHTVEHQQGGHIVSDSELSMTLARGPIQLTITQSSHFVETPEGQPVSCRSVMKTGLSSIEKVMTFDPAKKTITIIDEQFGQKQTHTVPWPKGQWFAPVAAERYIQKQTTSGAKTIDVRVLDGSSGATPQDMHMTRVGEQAVQVYGKAVPGIAWDTTSSAAPGIVMRQYIDADGRPLRMVIPLAAGMTVTMSQASEQLAKSPVNPPQILAKFFITPDHPIAQPRDLRQAVYELHFKGKAPPEGHKLARTGAQRVVWGDRDSAKVVVDLDRPLAPGKDTPTAADSAASAMLNWQDPKIAALLKKALGADGAKLTAAQKAERLRHFVYTYVQRKDLSVGLATASEVARTREGDCTEHAVLLAALLRAAKIPSRVAVGVVYVNQFLGHQGVFGGHMWTQAWLGGHWVDLDPTLSATQPFDAAHIALATSAMANRNANSQWLALASQLAQLQIDVVQPK